MASEEQAQNATRFVLGHVLRGTEADGFDEAQAYRLGRALGTLVRRRIGRAHDVAVARADGSPALSKLRAGLVRGLVLTGHRVLDGGILEAGDARRFVEATGAGAFFTRDDELGALHPFVGVGATHDDADPRPAREVAELADGGEWAAFAGSLELLTADDVAEQTPHVGAASP